MNTDKKRVRLWLYLCLSVPHLWLIAFSSFAFSQQTQFKFHAEQAGPPLVGFGAEMNPYVYCHPNWGDVTEENAKDLERKVLDLSPQHVRIFCLLEWFTPEGDKEIAKGDPLMKESFFRTIRLAEKAGASINITFWYGRYSLKKNAPDPPGLMEDTARDMTAVMNELLVNQKFTGIQYVTIQNEVNGEGHDGAHFKIMMPEYDRLYHLFDKDMREAGLRDRVKIIGGDLIYREQETWIPFISSHLKDACDGYSMHAYWDYWDTPKLVRRLREVRELFDEQPPDEHKPLYVTEFGVRGERPDPKHDDPGYFDKQGKQQITDNPIQGVQIAWFMMEAINRGYVATVQWDMYDALYDHVMHYGMIGDVKTGWKIRPAYEVLKLFTHTTKPGWRALQVEGADDDTIVSAISEGKDNLTIFALNHTPQAGAKRSAASAAPGRLLTGLPKSKTFQVFIWNRNNDGKSESSPPLQSDAQGNLSLPVLPSELLVLTTTQQK